MMVLTLSITILSYFMLLNKQSDHQTQNNKKIINHDIKKDDINEYFKKKYQEKKEDISQTFEEYTEAFEKEYIHPEPPIKKSKNQKQTITEENKNIKENKKVIQKPIVQKDTRPKLAIVIDDVTLQSQVNKILNLNYPVTMAFMPPTSNHKNSAKITRDLDFYIIHFPLQATSFKFEEENTLHVGDSYEKIENRVKQIRKWYPKALYTNNHTGSKFTEDDVSMDRLFKALKKYNFIFVDSRTTSKTVAKKYAKKYDMPYIARNIFLDNKQEFNYIQNQLKKAIKIAKKKGFAIAIGHPHKMTMKVLLESKNLFKDINLVQINQIPAH